MERKPDDKLRGGEAMSLISRVNWQTIVGGIVAFITIVGGVWAANDYVAKQKDLDYLSMRLEQKIQADEVRQLQQEMWRIEDRYGTDVRKMPESIRCRYRDIKARLAVLYRRGGN
jgi:hypothetical protein